MRLILEDSDIRTDIGQEPTPDHQAGSDNGDAVFADPIAYLAGFGIGAELVSVSLGRIPEAA